MFKYFRFKKFMRKRKQFDANVQTFCLTKSDRINRRIDNLTESYLHGKSVTKKDVRSLTKAIQIMIAQELTYKGMEAKKWK